MVVTITTTHHHHHHHHHQYYLSNSFNPKPNSMQFLLLLLITLLLRQKWRARASLFSGIMRKLRNDDEVGVVQSLKEELFEAIVRKLEKLNKIKEPLKSDLLNGKWELIYTTSQTLLQTQIPIKSRGSGRGQLEITYLDEELRISRGGEGNLFVLKMDDPLYRVPI